MPGFILNAINTFAQSLLDTFFTGIWVASLAVLRAAFALVDVVSGFSLTFTAAGNPAATAAAAPAPGAGAGMAGAPLRCPGGVAPVGGQCVLDATIAAPWQLLRTLSLVIATALFFWQLGSTMLRGGRGFFHTATGPLAYGIALAATGGLVAALLGAADAVSSALLGAGFGRVIGFAGVLDNPKFNGVFTAGDAGQAAVNGTSAIALGVIAVFGMIPVALGYMGEMVFREGAILVLVATIPITAAGLVAHTSSSWFWRTLRWIIAAILMKPALALVLVIGVSTLANPQGLGGLLAGVGLLLMALFCPYALFRLLSFVDPGTGAGASSRAWAASALASLSPGGGAGQVETGSGVAMAEAANTARFDQAGAGSSSGASGGSGSSAGGGGSDAITPDAPGAGSSSGGSGAGSSGGGSSGGGGLAARAGQAVGQGAAAVAAGAARVTNFANAQLNATGVGDPGGGTIAGGQGSPASSQSGNGPSGSGQSGSGPSGSGPSGGGDSPAGHGGDSPAGQDPSATVSAAGEPAPPAAAPAGPGSGSGTGGDGQDPPPATPPPGPEGSGPEGSGPEGSGPRPPTPPAGGGGGGHKPGGGSGGASAGEVEEAAVIA